MNKQSFWKSLGPGLITGASDDDPSGIATYSQAGARYGFALLWVLPLIYPMLVAIQEVTARIGRVTGRGLSSNIREHYSPKLAGVFVLLLLAANIINIGADIAAMGEAMSLIVSGPSLLYAALLTVVSLGLQIFIPYSRYVKVLRYLTLVLFSYVIVSLMVGIDWLDALKSMVIPDIRLTSEYLTMIIAILGTTISPYLFFWQASEEAEEEEDDPDMHPLREAPEQAREQFKRINIDTMVGMAFSNAVALFIMLATAATLNANGITNIESATQAAQALQPLAGKYAFLFFALGIIGTGLLALPVLAGSAAFAVGELFKAPVGLEKKPSQAKFFYGVLAVATLVGFGLNLIHISPITALFYAAVINGVVAVPIMVMMMLMSHNTKVMGRFRLPRWMTILGWLATGIMLIAAIGLFV